MGPPYIENAEFFCQHQNRPDFGRKSIKNPKILSDKNRLRQFKRKTLYVNAFLRFVANSLRFPIASSGEFFKPHLHYSVFLFNCRA
jgi:hypothetical protein